jgi:hypothetical protein
VCKTCCIICYVLDAIKKFLKERRLLKPVVIGKQVVEGDEEIIFINLSIYGEKKSRFRVKPLK